MLPRGLGRICGRRSPHSPSRSRRNWFFSAPSKTCAIDRTNYPSAYGRLDRLLSFLHCRINDGGSHGIGDSFLTGMLGLAGAAAVVAVARACYGIGGHTELRRNGILDATRQAVRRHCSTRHGPDWPNTASSLCDGIAETAAPQMRDRFARRYWRHGLLAPVDVPPILRDRTTKPADATGLGIRRGLREVPYATDYTC